MPLHDVIDKLRCSLHERGLAGTLRRLGGSLVDGYEKEELLVLVKELRDIQEPKGGEELRVEELDASHLPGIYALNRQRDEPEADRYFDQSLEYGYHGFAGLVGDRLVGYYWWVDRDNPVPHPDLFRLGREFELEDGDVYGSSLYLLEAYRGGGRAGQFLYQVESRLRDRGYRRLWGYVDKGNRAARWLYAMRGYLQTWQVCNHRLAFLRWRRSTPLSGSG